MFISLFLFLIGSLLPDLLHAQNELSLTSNVLKNSNQVQKTGMIILGSWGTLNLLSGSYGFYHAEGELRYFHQMNAAWNLVNLGIAGFGFYGALNADLSLIGNEALVSLQQFDRILLINAGLDLLYIGAGAWMWKRGQTKGSDRLLGYGKSVVLQGGFLLLFDLGLYWIHHYKTSELLQITNSLSLGPTGIKLSF